MSDEQQKSIKEEFKDKQDNLLSDLGLIETGMSEDLQVDDADIIDCTIKHINMLSTDLEKCAQSNEVFAVTNKALMAELNNKSKNLLSFHAANTLQAKIVAGSTLTDDLLVAESVELANKMIAAIKHED